MNIGQSRSQYWEELNLVWQQSHPQALWRAHSDAVNVRLFASWLPPQPLNTVLKTDLFDEAVSVGLYPLLAARARNVIGVDLSREAVAGARRRYPDALGASADIRCLPFPDGTFDVIVSNSTLDHFERMEDMHAALRELFRILRAGGHLLLTLDNLANPAVAIRNALPFSLAHCLGLVPYKMGWTCGPRRLCRILRGIGFRIEEVRAILHCPRAPAVALASKLERHSGPRGRTLFLRGLAAFERLADWPTRFLTGYFIAVKAGKPRDTFDEGRS